MGLKTIVGLFIAGLITTTSIYTYTIPNSEGGDLAMSAYQGKKIMIVTLPVVQSNAADAMLYSLDTIARARQSTHTVIAVPSIEDGYSVENKSTLLTWYRSKLDTTIIITGGLYTRKTSGAQQHPLFKWLTTGSVNESFDQDVDGPGFKFFVTGTGELYAVLSAPAAMGSPLVTKALQMQ